ncbi:winged helix-turn-helix domain-containing protein [Colwellia polaris]|jgi:DNA-binding winged helix-turn-helix (wHTH) protein/Tol biopolymer transport system component|uniref:winged helix-turn-helix domain-containing protein n=1 Tax=Colwellia polaris TaxID=326537 RepID=UPI000A17366F|nr:winged helix-turn-helix domain-containing protein [Colwellia polaris]|tara:strand:- start:6830 stop:8881 length:2052 start_codon:yes stop_codon:yes gene_type:complete
MKSNNFVLGQHHVDVARNLIKINGQINRLPPKAIALLCVLAENQGEVYSIEDIMKIVWEDRIVSSNSLQSCISQLRKALNDDAQTQRVIKTHSKKGYSLEIPVTHFDSSSSKASYLRLNTFWRILFVTLIVVIAYWFHPLSEKNKQHIEVSPITSSDDWESGASYGPGGNFIIFQRYIDNCYSNIWLKEVSSHKEKQLTYNKGVYGKPSWSNDGNHITFTERNACKPSQVDEEYCWSVNTLSVLDAITSPQKPVRRLECQSNPAWLAKWLPTGDISYLTEKDGSTMIQLYSPKTQKVITLFEVLSSYTYSYDFSVANSTFALLSLNEKNDHVFRVLSLTGEVISKALIKLPLNFPRDRALKIKYHPSGEYVTVSSDSRIYRLDVDGELSKIDIGGRLNLTDFSFHPNGQLLIATEIVADTDIVLLPKTLFRKNIEISSLDGYKLARSNLSEDMPKFQPLGERIAYTSNRSGIRQLWLFNKENVQLSQGEYGLQSKTIAWSPTGTMIAGISENKVQIWQLDGHYQKIETKLHVESVMQWYSVNELLVTAIIDGHSTLHKLNIKTKAMKNLGIKNILWANYGDNGQLFYLKRNGKFWRNAVKPVEMPKLNNQFEQPFAVYNSGELYGINNDRQLWVYSIADDTFGVLSTLPENVRYLSDFNGSDFLITQMKQLKKDLLLIKHNEQ